MPFVIATFVAFFLALLIFTKKRGGSADRVLGVWLLTIGLHFLLFCMSCSENRYVFPHLLGVGVFFPFLHGPLLLLYTQALTDPETYKKRRKWLHFVLPVIVICLYAPFFVSSGDDKVAVYVREGTDYAIQNSICQALLTVSGIYYALMTIKRLHHHKQHNLHKLSNQTHLHLNWLRLLVYGMAALWFIIIFIRGDEHIFSFATVFVLMIGYVGIRQAGVFTDPVQEMTRLIEAMPDDQAVEKVKYAKSRLTEDLTRQLHEQLVDVIRTEKPYLDPDLTLLNLANRLDIHPNYLSQIINVMEGVAFYDYINALRVEAFLERVQKPESQLYTLLTLAYDCGFNSKTSFNRNFKKITHCSPTEYLKTVPHQMKK